MNHRHSRILLLLILLPLLNVSSVLAETVTFDDLDPIWSHNVPLGNGYAGLAWMNFRSMHVLSQYGSDYATGYVTGMASPGFVVYNDGGAAAEFSSAKPFNFVGVYLTAAWLDNLEITVEGFLDSTLVEAATVKVSPTARQWFTFDFKGVNRVTFTPSGGTQLRGYSGAGTFFVMDDLEIAGDETEVTTITIDIKPGDGPNPINPKSKGVIPVAILTTESFDATTVDPSTAYFGPTGTETLELKAVIEDVNGDGRLDMLLFFATQGTRIRCGDSSAMLKARTLGGEDLQGTDSIKTVPCK
jgi:hypothetical protein